ncbi:hypothetical protein F4781DRAFT_348264 [Annulohypoxylon bovei var. microspora]|nr:hypothetical protein F4781DRAFT_348264 [Annulohypoxylon bovei var. microspora]
MPQHTPSCKTRIRARAFPNCGVLFILVFIFLLSRVFSFSLFFSAKRSFYLAISASHSRAHSCNSRPHAPHPNFASNPRRVSIFT